MEKLKRFKSAGKKAIASALVLGLGAGLFAGCNPGSKLEKLPEPEFNEELYDNITSSSKIFNEKYFENIEKEREIYNKWFSDPNYFGGLIKDYDEIVKVYPYKFDDNKLLLCVYTRKDGRQTIYNIMNKNLAQDEKCIDTAYSFGNGNLTLEELENFIKQNNINSSNLEVIASSSSAENELFEKTKNLLYNSTTNDTTYLEWLGLLDYAKNGYDIYVIDKNTGTELGAMLNNSIDTFYLENNAYASIVYILPRSFQFGVIYDGTHPVDTETGSIIYNDEDQYLKDVRKKLELYQQCRFICVNDKTGDIKTFGALISYTTIEHLYESYKVKEYDEIEKDKAGLAELSKWQSNLNNNYSYLYQLNNKYRKLLETEIKNFINSKDIYISASSYGSVASQVNETSPYIYDIVNGLNEECKLVDADEFSKINDVEIEK